MPHVMPQATEHPGGMYRTKIWTGTAAALNWEFGPECPPYEHRAQSMCRRKEEVDEARPRRRRSQWYLRSRGARGQMHYVKVVKPCNPNKKEARARRNPWDPRQVGPWRGGRGGLREVLRSSQARLDKNASGSRRCNPGFGQGAAPSGGSRLGKHVFFPLAAQHRRSFVLRVCSAVWIVLVLWFWPRVERWAWMDWGEIRSISQPCMSARRGPDRQKARLARARREHESRLERQQQKKEHERQLTREWTARHPVTDEGTTAPASVDTLTARSGFELLPFTDVPTEWPDFERLLHDSGLGVLIKDGIALAESFGVIMNMGRPPKACSIDSVWGYTWTYLWTCTGHVY